MIKFKWSDIYARFFKSINYSSPPPFINRKCFSLLTNGGPFMLPIFKNVQFKINTNNKINEYPRTY